MPKKQKFNTWLLYWCNEGLECAINVSEVEAEHLDAEQANMWSILSAPEGQKPKHIKTAGEELNRTFQHLVLRAQFNQQRHYEMYTVGMPKDITKEDITLMFEDSPQAMVDLIRERGNKLYSDAAGKKKAVIV